ncbi:MULTISPECIES: MFS transporter [unclassified Enterococcus]|uniref:MFS transporter n=1 Tax=unclassified Enterococcus TaxID=2608891 RepID=UPI001556DD07|nr:MULTISPECIES: MFS transporter [unclassified Enterococcus]MBS7577512.1 MFS transporter [Enterococcus sp. MMGLQ5-2]MBS7584989.1 MFS transporter [Enterococcus sp. MMGLQ5-1]NPD12844.1 MFS transporter [Enterococcus sp. MMGLQ5-1]NPD37345.1 MFS transporter [Enterococcus sp. MMGLQ5-2]
MTETSASLPFKHWRRNLNLFFFGQFLSGITSMIVQYSIVWYLTQTTGSATVLSFATLLAMLPMAILSPLVGPIVDRFNKKALLIITDSVVAFFAVILSITGTLANQFPLWLILISLLMRSIAQTFQMPIIQSILPTMIPKNEITRVNGQLGMVQSGNMIIAPALGAFLFAIMPMNLLILLDVLGAIIGITLLIFVIIPQTENRPEKLHLLSNTQFGFQQLINNKGLWYITIIVAFFTLFLMPAASMYPLMTLDYFGGTVAQAGLIEACFSGGMLLGGLYIGVFGKWQNRMKPIFWGYFFTGITVGISGLLPGNQSGFIWFAILNAIAGLATPFLQTLLMAMIQESYPPEQLGRIMGVLNSLMTITGPIGLVFAGPLADLIGVEKLFIIAGIGILACGIANFMIPKARNYDLSLHEKLNK